MLILHLTATLMDFFSYLTVHYHRANLTIFGLKNPMVNSIVRGSGKPGHVISDILVSIQTVIMQRRVVSMVKNSNQKGVRYLQRPFQYQNDPSDNSINEVALPQTLAGPSKRSRSGPSVKNVVLGKSTAMSESQRNRLVSDSRNIGGKGGEKV